MVAGKDKLPVLRCYCCGEKLISRTFAIVTMADETDRVFVMMSKHVERVSDGKSIIVRRVKI